MRLVYACLVCLSLLVPTAQAADIERIEPANWWIGMQHNRVELLVHGKGIATASPRLSRAGVAIVDVQKTDNPNYLFVTVEVAADAKPGELAIEFVDAGKVVATHPWRIDAREPGSAQRQGFSNADAIYLITPDRFANGDPSNDSVAGMREAANRNNPNGRHGGDIAGIRQHLDYIAGMGFTQLWPTPFLENKQPAYSYHGYAITDLYRTDPRMGTNEDVRALSREARTKGIGLIMDIVLNHIGSQHWWIRDLPAKDWINNGAKFAPTNHRRTTLQDPHAAPADRAAFTDGWFVSAMPDLNQRNPQLARYLIQNTLWWIEYAGLSGIREDTFGYADTQFLSVWAKAVLDEYPNFAMVGEEWSINPAVVAHWQRGKVNPDGHVPYMPSMMDFPIHLALRNALVQPEGWETGWMGLYEMLANDFLYPDPGALVVFAENHDTARLLAHVDGDLALWKLGMAYLATVRGTPQFYYGSEVLLRGPKERNDGLLRADMPGGWAGDAADAFTGNDISAAQRDAQDYTRALFNWRKRNALLHTGKLTHFAPADGVYVYFRHDGPRGVMVALNKNAESASLSLDRFDAFLHGRSAREALSGKPVALGETLTLPAKSAVLLEIE
ncbi:glycoside hydrolase family 13 protein [Thermomonas sp. HDW16]|uniref:glycoside hydrolase family 13 protein n=1 Tax=Thermomonas sp. HDW16 TaxID=2714945 RepID=UPI00140A5F5C|nr:glycoside hydrolase family 13 protein [Thermomonas sp. HDW16]QIL19682.1 glycoside hydrolase family 13 protein [Thermomonas sp. HDW16]